MASILLRAFLDSTGQPPFRDIPDEFIATLPVPSRHDGRKTLVSLWGMSAKGGSRFVGVASGIVYDIDQNAGRSISMRRKLDEPVYPAGSTQEALAEYGELLDREAPVFFASGQLPSIAHWRELIVALVGPGIWKIYGDLAPDFVKAVGPIAFAR